LNDLCLTNAMKGSELFFWPICRSYWIPSRSIESD